MTTTAILERLAKVRARGSGTYTACCPAHADKNPSLAIREAGEKLLVKCWAGCTASEIVSAIGLSLKDLFINGPVPPGPRSSPPPKKIDLDETAFRFEMAALDRRLRAERVLAAIAPIGNEGMEDEHRDRLMNVVARAHHDQDRAAFLESMADDLRAKACEQRSAHHAA